MSSTDSYIYIKEPDHQCWWSGSFRVGSEGFGSASAGILASRFPHGAESYSAQVSGNFLRICALVRFGSPQP